MASKAVELADDLVFAVTGRHLSDLQRTILQQVWQGRRYLDIAHGAGYTEGHIKDVAYQLWQVLSRVTGEKVTKATLKSALERYCRQVQPAQPPALNDSPTAAGRDVLRLALAPISRPEPPCSGDRPTPGPEPSTWTFVGRQGALQYLQDLIDHGHRAIVIQGEGGLGKTTLAQHFVAHQSVELTLDLLMAKDAADLTPVEWVVEEWLRQDFGVEPGREFGVTLDRLKRHLRHQRVMVLIDNLEPCLDAQGRFLPNHRHYGELLRILTEPRSQTITLITSRDRLCEPGLPLTHYRLPGLDLAAWATYFSQRGLVVEGSALVAMHRAYGGNAKAMELLGGTIQADFGGDLASYWHLHQETLLEPIDLKNLVDSQIHRLRQLDPAAYGLFCRLAVYRYQEVPTVPQGGVLALMADFPPEHYAGLIASLRNRSLLEYHQGRYWLHPVVRQGALAQRSADPKLQADWQAAHRNAARYWTDSIQRISTLTDALQALEAYYHYVAIQDFGAAARVILHSRDNQWQQFLPLGSTLYRMGLVQPIADAITTVLGHIPADNADASELHNILGDLRWIQGRLQDAIACQQNALALAQANLKTLGADRSSHRWYYLTMLAVDSQLSLGLYYLDLWDLDLAATWFAQVIHHATGTRHQPWADKATTCLALVRAYQGQLDQALALATAITPTVMDQGGSGRHAFFVQLLGHAYLNLGDLAIAEHLFSTAMVAAEAGHYLQIKANALSGLAQLKAQAGDREGAIAAHQQAISLLEEVGAQCDLATAHLHLAKTLACLPDHSSSQWAAADHHRQIALRLFAAIPAPKQVERTRAQGDMVNPCN